MSPPHVSAEDRMLSDVLEGLSGEQKELSPKYFYDARGSELFESITELPEYYLTSAERALLEEHAQRWVRRLAPSAVVELGAGSAAKTRVLLDALVAGSSTRPLFVPLDVSDAFLQETARVLRLDYPGLMVSPEVADFTQGFDLSHRLPRPTLFALLGSTIGNFGPDQAVEVLTNVAHIMTPADAFLLGVDLRPGGEKTVADLEAAYNDPAGITAEFNLNILSVLNRELGADFDPDRFSHRAFYNSAAHRIEMHLVSSEPQTVTFEGEASIRLEGGETIRTEISCKYDRSAVEDLFLRSDLTLLQWQKDGGGRYAMAWGTLAT